MLERKEQCVTIFRGDDTGGQLGKTIIINFHCGDTVDMEGVVVTFVFGGFYEKEFRNVHDGDRLEIFMTHEQTAKLPLGVSFGKLYGTDASGKIRTFSNRIPIRVTNRVCEAYGSTEESGIDVTISNAITWDSIFGKPETFPPSEHRHQKSDIDDLENDLQTLSDGVKSAIEAAEAAKTEAAKGVRTVNGKGPIDGNVKIVLDDLADKDGNIETTKTIKSTGDVSISGSLSLTSSTPKITANQKDFLFPTESGKLARAEDYYTTAEVDDKITTFVAHYLTGRDSAGHFVPFATRAALDYAKQHHTEEDPQFFYAGEPFTPTKNDYCVVLEDETVEGKTARYSFVGEWPTGSWQYQYTINDTAFSEAQWDAINSGVTSKWMERTLSALEAEVARAQAAEAQLTTKAENAQTAANAASEKADAANAALANKLDKTAVVAPSSSATAGQAADAKAVNDALGGKLDKSGGTIEGAIIAEGHAGQAVFGDGGLYATNYDGISTDYKGNAIVHDGKELLFPQGDGTFALTSDIEDAVKDKADRASLALEYSATSAYPVGSIVYHDGNIYQCTTAIAEGGEAWNAAHWELRKLSDFFTESNSLLNGRLAYKRNATGLKDRAFNTLSFDGTEFNLSTALEAVTPTASGQPRDLLIVATATAATTISYTAGTIKGDKPTIDGSGTWLITLTEYASGVWYCRQIKMEDAA